jgi:hypothetical protein
MAERLKSTDLKGSLVQAKSELQELLSRAERLKVWIAATERLCSKRGQGNDSDDTETDGVIRFRRTKAAVLATHVIEVIKAAGHPMHVRNIVEELAKRQHPVIAKNAVATVAVALGRRPEQFVKTGRNIFDVVEKDDDVKAVG